MKSSALAAVAFATAAVLSTASANAAPAAPASRPDRATSATTATAPGEVALTWAPEYMSTNHQFSQAEAVAIANQFDVVAAMPVAFAKYTSVMRAANPSIKFLAYSNATFADPNTTASGLPESAYAHTASGARIRSNNFGLTLMEPSSPLWRSRSVTNCAQRVQSGGYDGCLLDMLTMAVYTKGYTTGTPTYPGTATDYTQPDWRSALITLGQDFASTHPTQTFVGNAIGNFWSYWHNPVTTQPIAAGLQSSQMEDFLRGSADPVSAFPTVSDWVDNVNTITDMEAMGRPGFYSTKMWVSQTPAQTKQWQAFAMASFLMGANGNSYFAFTPTRTSAGATGGSNPYPMPRGLGAPTSVMAQLNGLYLRSFANGLAVVNPGRVPITVTLNGPATDLDGTSVTTFSLAPNSGQVLRPAQGSTAPLDVQSAAPDVTNSDVVAPTAVISSVSQDSSRMVTIAGTVDDDVAVGTLTVSLYSYASRAWLSPISQWGTHYKLPVQVSLPSKSAGWSFSAQLPAGTYGIGLQVADTSKNVLSPAPWVKFTVS